MPIEVVHLTHCYSEGSALRTVALNDVSFRVEDGEFVFPGKNLLFDVQLSHCSPQFH